MGWFVLKVLLAVALWGRQVHSVAVEVLPVGFVVEWLWVLGKECNQSVYIKTTKVRKHRYLRSENLSIQTEPKDLKFYFTVFIINLHMLYVYCPC